MRKLLFLFALISGAAFAEGENAFNVAAHSLSGSYEKILGEMISVCSNDKFEIAQAKGITGGGTGNLEALANNKAQAAIVRSDVVTALTQADASYRRFQTLVTLYPEPVHVVVLRESKSKKKGLIVIGTTNFNSLSEIGSDFTVGGGGGTIYTLKILKGQAGAQYNIGSYEDSKSLMSALDSGEIAAAVFVGAAPLPNLVALDKGKYKIVPVGENIVDKVKGIYTTTTVTYAGLSEGPVHTIASKLVVLTRRFSTPQRLAAQRYFRECLAKNLSKLQDDGSPAWQQVDANDRGTLDWYDIP